MKKERIDLEKIKDLKCKFRMYGDVEKLCIKCGYIIWFNGKDTDLTVLNNMVNSGYPIPNCNIKS